MRCINYYSKNDIIFPETQLNVSDLNQVPFSPSIVVQCKYSFCEADKFTYRGEYVRIEQSNGDNYGLYYFNECKTAFNWIKWVHNGPIVHKVNLIRNFERIDQIGHKDPNIWLILKHSIDASFGIAFITGKSLVEVGGSEENKITYPPAYFHLNGVHEKGEVVLFDNGSSGGYDARKGFNDGDCLLHPAGVGHGGDKDIYKHFIIKAIIKYILELGNKDMMKNLINRNKYQRFINLDEKIRNMTIDKYIKKCIHLILIKMYMMIHRILNGMLKNINIAIDAILNENNNDLDLQILGMPFGIGYLLVECRDSIIPKPRYNSTFGEITPVSYGMGVDINDKINIYKN